jgi:hypothetical protein
LADLPQEERETFVTCFTSLSTKDMAEYNKGGIMRALLHLPHQERKAFVTDILSLAIEDMTVDDRVEAIEVLAHLPYKNREAVVKSLLDIWTQDIPAYEKVMLIEDLADLPQEERETFVTSLTSLWTDDMERSNKFAIIRAMLHLPQEEREIFVTGILSLTTEDMAKYDKATIIGVLAKLPQKERKKFVTFLPDLVIEHTVKDDRATIVEKLIKAYYVKLQETTKKYLYAWSDNIALHNTKDIIEGLVDYPMDEQSIISVMGIFDKIPYGDRQSFIENARLFLTPKISILKWIETISILSKIEVLEVKKLTTILQPQSKIMDAVKWPEVLYELIRVPHHKRIKVSKQFVFLWECLHQEDHSQLDNSTLIQIAYNILQKGSLPNLIKIIEKVVNDPIPLKPECTPAVSRNSLVSQLGLSPQGLKGQNMLE